MKHALAYILPFVVLITGCELYSYPEYKLAPLPANISKQYLQNSSAYLEITTAEESVIEQTLSQNNQLEHKLMTFPREKLRVLMVYDLAKNTQSINISSLQNAYELTRSLSTYSKKGQIFPFQINGYYNSVYTSIREEIITSIKQGAIVQINAIGSATAYSTLLAIELRMLQVPVESVVNFGSTRFASAASHADIAQQLEGIMINVTHENDINHQMYMGVLPNEYALCSTKNCHETIREQKYFSKGEIRRHISSFPLQYIELYRNSLNNNS